MIENNNKPLYDGIEGKKILIIDNDNDSVFLQKELLIRGGFEKENIITKLNSFDALEYLKKNIVDLIITDVFLPSIDGIQMIDEIKKEGIGGNPKIVVVSSVYNDNLNVDMSMQKPFEGKTFSDKIFDVLMKENDILIEE